MTANAFYSGARKAIRLAHECEREATCDDRIWHVYMLSEARRHRERAAWYLQSHKWQLENRAVPANSQLKETSHDKHQ